MKKYIVIKDLDTDKYYNGYQVHCWNRDITEAKLFNDEGLALSELSEDYLIETFEGKFISLQTIYLIDKAY